MVTSQFEFEETNSLPSEVCAVRIKFVYCFAFRNSACFVHAAEEIYGNLPLVVTKRHKGQQVISSLCFVLSRTFSVYHLEVGNTRMISCSVYI